MHVQWNITSSSGRRMEMVVTAIVALVIFGLIIALPVSSWYYAKCTQETIQFTVKEKLVKRQGGKDSKDAYMIFTEEHGVLENTDSFWNWKWNSSDIWSGLEVGKTYTATTYGWRVPMLSWYPNIVEATALPTTTAEDLDTRIKALKADLAQLENKRVEMAIAGSR